VLDTGKAMQAFGAEVINHGGGSWSVHGCGRFCRARSCD
jgi:3-phosphoshikimate 1-carboxyvinyltransferase